MSETAIRPKLVAATPRERLVNATPVLLAPALALLGLLAIGSPSTWLTLTVAGLAMGLMIFIMASGLTVVFGLMDVINFGHGAFVTVGAFVGFSVLAWMSGLGQSEASVAAAPGVRESSPGASLVHGVPPRPAGAVGVRVPRPKIPISHFH